MQSRAIRLKKKVVEAMVSNLLIQRRKGIVDRTVEDFRNHYLKVKMVNMFKVYLMQTRKNNLLEQVAD
jgi:hypothetical protein